MIGAVGVSQRGLSEASVRSRRVVKRYVGAARVMFESRLLWVSQNRGVDCLKGWGSWARSLLVRERRGLQASRVGQRAV